MIRTIDISASRHYPTGGWELCSLGTTYTIRRLFLGYTKREAIRIFRAYLRRQVAADIA